MIFFVHQGFHSYTHKSLLDEPAAGRVACCSYRELLSLRSLPKGCYVFTDRERMDPWELRLYGALFRHINEAGPAYRAINDPAKMADRQALLRALFSAGLNDFDVYRLTERRRPRRWPVFLRREFDHKKPLTRLIRNDKEFDAALLALDRHGEPEDGVLVVEYCAEPVMGKLFRKLSAYRLGEEMVFFNTVHEENWLVKYGSLNSATDALYEEEQAMIRDNAFADELWRAFEVGHIDYGRADFGLVNGRVQIYEINTNPNTKPGKEHPNPIRNKSQAMAWQRYCEALGRLDTTDPDGPDAPVFMHKDLVRRQRDGASLEIEVVRR